MAKTLNRRKGLSKRCEHAGTRAEERCPHPWWMHFVHRAVGTRRLIKRYRLSIDVVAGQHVEHKTDAEVIMDRVKTQIREGTFTGRDKADAGPARVTFADVMAQYIDGHFKATGLNLESSKYTLDALVAYFGPRVFRDIGTIDVEAYLAALRAPIKMRDGETRARAVNTLNRHVSRLRHLFTWSTHRGLIERSPFVSPTGALLIREFRGENTRQRRLAAGEEPRLLLKADDALRDWIVVALDTGMRRGEQFGIRVRDVNLTTRKIRIGAWSKGRTERTIPIATERAYDVLARACFDETGLLRPADGHVFANAIGEGYTGNRLTNVIGKEFRRVCRALGIVDLHWHDLRHEFASRLYYDCDVKLQVVQRLLGHKSIDVTMKYLNIHEEGIEKAVTALDRLLSKNDTVVTRRLKQKSGVA